MPRGSNSLLKSSNPQNLLEQGQQKGEWFVSEHWMPFKESVIALFISPDAAPSSTLAQEEEEEVVVIPQHKDVEDLIQPSMKKMDDNEPPPIVESPMTQQTMYTVAVQDTINDEHAKDTVPEPSKKSEQ